MTTSADPSFDSIFDELSSRTDEDGFVFAAEDDIDRWAEDRGLTWRAFIDTFAAQIAVRYHAKAFDFAFGDSLVNDLWSEMVCRTSLCSMDDWSTLLYDVYDAFDAGEFTPGHTQEEAVIKFTNPGIEEIVGKLNAP